MQIFGIDFRLNYNNREHERLNNNLNDTNRNAQGATRSTNTLSKSTKQNGLITSATAIKMGALAVSLYGVKKATDAVIGVGFKHNIEMDAAKSKLLAITMGSRGYKDEVGNVVTASERMIRINKEVSATMKMIKKVNYDTTMGMSELINIYALSKTGMEAENWALKDQMEILKLVSNTASVLGVEATALTSGIDDLAKGTWESTSEFGKMMKALGINKKEYEKSTDKINLLKKAMKETGKMQDNWAAAVSRFQNTWKDMSSKVTKPLFNIAQKSLELFQKKMSKVDGKSIENLSITIMNFAQDSIKNLAGILKFFVYLKAGVNTLSSAFKVAFYAIQVAYYKMEDALMSGFEDIMKYAIKFRGIFSDDAETQRALDNLHKAVTKNNDAIKDGKEAMDSLNKNTDEFIQNSLESGKAIDKIDSMQKSLNATVSEAIKITKKEQEQAKKDAEIASKKQEDFKRSLNNSTAERSELNKKKENAKKAKIAYDNLQKSMLSVYKFLGNDKKALEIEVKLKTTELKKNGVDPLTIEKVISKMRLDLKKKENEEKMALDKKYIDELGTKEQQFQQTLIEKRNELRAIKMDEVSIQQVLANMSENEAKKQQTINNGMSEYFENLKSRTENYKDMTINFMNTLESTLNNSLGKFFDSTSKNFMSLKALAKDFGQTMLNQLQKILIQKMVVAAVSMFKNGGAISGGVSAFKNGGTFTNEIVSKPTLFANGTAKMGEHGAEAIMPLKRTKNGSLGVQVSGNSGSNSNVNIIINNNANVAVKQSQNSKGETVLTIEDVDSHLINGIASRSGDFYHAMSANFKEN